MKNQEKVTTDQELLFFLTFFYKNISVAEFCRQKQSLIKSTRVGGDKAVQGAALKLGEKHKRSEKSGSSTAAVS